MYASRGDYPYDRKVEFSQSEYDDVVHALGRVDSGDFITGADYEIIGRLLDAMKMNSFDRFFQGSVE